MFMYVSRHTAAVIFADVGCFELSAEAVPARRGGSTCAPLGLARLVGLILM